MPNRVTINLNILTLDRLFGGDLARYVDQARAIEDAGIDGIVMPDHVVFGDDATYPFGAWTVAPSDSWPEPMAVLAAVAGATRRVDLVTNVLIAPLRSAVLLAKQVATLYGLSGGRFQLGVGTGWQEQEYVASGQSFAARGDMLFDQMRACRALWLERPATFRSEHVNFEKIWCSPGLPGSAEHSPLKLWFGFAPSAANARYFAEFDAGWSCIKPDPGFIAEGRARLEGLLRDRYGITKRLRVRAAPAIHFDASGAVSIDRTIDHLHESIEAGVTDFDVPLMFYVKEADRLPEFLNKLGSINRTVAE
ncbi:TIGR03619 family F420-dependent LLM class oxidoreductase [Flavisphingomonas formosensis]|uniref:TIGR03619 family F420-dependent LLM class oxidoreductase n=1 Tax=Flavisphingomonas formosensis TaxID=861534 RepID=UPI0012FA4E14|nr:TIGR03619 family F420-dependent LLM class oxidoreductase [Sphingomonas formosensis]